MHAQQHMHGAQAAGHDDAARTMVRVAAKLAVAVRLGDIVVMSEVSTKQVGSSPAVKRQAR